MSNGVNKLELGYDSLFYGLWHIIFSMSGGVNKLELGYDISTSQTAARPSQISMLLLGEGHSFSTCAF